jgi:hypothetical protein
MTPRDGAYTSKLRLAAIPPRLLSYAEVLLRLVSALGLRCTFEITMRTTGFGLARAPPEGDSTSPDVSRWSAERSCIAGHVGVDLPQFIRARCCAIHVRASLFVGGVDLYAECPQTSTSIPLLINPC